MSHIKESIQRLQAWQIIAFVGLAQTVGFGTAIMADRVERKYPLEWPGLTIILVMMVYCFAHSSFRSNSPSLHDNEAAETWAWGYRLTLLSCLALDFCAVVLSGQFLTFTTLALIIVFIAFLSSFERNSRIKKIELG